jgi:hypothetical protein
MLVISSPNTDRSLLTTAERRAAAGVADGSRDPELALLGAYVDAAITKACRVATAGATPPTLRLESVSETQRIDRHHQLRAPHHSSHPAPIILARTPVVSVVSVTENDTLLDATDYEAETAAGLLYRLSGSCRVSWCYGTVVAAYSAGYETVPDDLKYAAVKFVQAELQRAGRDPLLTLKRIEGVSEYRWFADPTKDSVVPPEVMDLLERGGFVNEMVI